MVCMYRGGVQESMMTIATSTGYSNSLYSLVLDCFCRILVGVPNGTTEGFRVQQTGYVLECPLTPGPCTPLRGSGEGNDTLLYDETSGLPVTNSTSGACYSGYWQK